MNKEKESRKAFGHSVKKYCRWMRLYLRRVRLVERELGCQLYSC